MFASVHFRGFPEDMLTREIIKAFSQQIEQEMNWGPNSLGIQDNEGKISGILIEHNEYQNGNVYVILLWILE